MRLITANFDRVNLTEHVLNGCINTKCFLLLRWRYQRRWGSLAHLLLRRNLLLLLILLLLQLVVEAIEHVLLVQ